MSGRLVKDRIPALQCDKGARPVIMVLDKNLFALELQKRINTDLAMLNDSIGRRDMDSMIHNIANIQLCIKHLCEAWEIPQNAVEHVYSVMFNEQGGYDARLFQMDEKPEKPVSGA